MHEQVMHAFGRICGQNAATSPFVLGYQGPLCWRCTGIYLALACAVVVARRWDPAPSAFLAHVALAVGALVLLALDGERGYDTIVQQEVYSDLQGKIGRVTR